MPSRDPDRGPWSKSSRFGSGVAMKFNALDAIAFIVIVVGALLAGGRWLIRQYEIDTCLDSGGRFNDANAQWEHNSSEKLEGRQPKMPI